MPSSLAYKLLEACRAEGCPVCRLEQGSVERYLDRHFYENVNSPKWRDRLRGSLGFCREHAWLGVNRRLGDALGYSIIYHDILNSILRQWQDEDEKGPTHSARGRSSFRTQIPEPVRTALLPRKACPVCEHRDQTTRTLLSVIVEELKTPEMTNALQSSDGLCLSHLLQALEHLQNTADVEALLTIHRKKLENLRAELAEFIRKNDYQVIKEGFGKEGDAWLRAIGMVVGRRGE